MASRRASYLLWKAVRLPGLAGHRQCPSCWTSASLTVVARNRRPVGEQVGVPRPCTAADGPWAVVAALSSGTAGTCPNLGFLSGRTTQEEEGRWERRTARSGIWKATMRWTSVTTTRGGECSAGDWLRGMGDGSWTWARASEAVGVQDEVSEPAGGGGRRQVQPEQSGGGVAAWRRGPSTAHSGVQLGRVLTVC